MVDKLAKEAAVEDGPVVYDKIPRKVLVTRVQENGLNMWQRQWTDTGKGAVTKAFFPLVRNRLREKNSHFTAIYGIGDRTREAKIISPQIWNNG